jgi:Fe-S oxidoreductase
MDLRQYLVMEQSSSPSELNGMFTNMENNGAPWQFAQADRLNWAKEA